MKNSDPAPLAPSTDLQRMLQQLGREDATLSREPQAEAARELRMAMRLDDELADLVKARQRWRRAAYGLLAAAALVALGLAARHTQFGPGALPIAAEPSLGSKAELRSTAAAQPAVSATAATLPSALRRASSAATGATATAPLSSVEPESTLAEENRLFKDAAEAGRKGDVAGAVVRLDKLLVEHPTSPLAQAALVQKFRLLTKAGKLEEARHVAQRYLAAYPTGFAVNEAQALKDGGAGQGKP